MRKVNLKGVTDALVNHRNNGAVVLVATPVLGGDANEGIPDDLTIFSKLVAPVMKSLFKSSP